MQVFASGANGRALPLRATDSLYTDFAAALAAQIIALGLESCNSRGARHAQRAGWSPQRVIGKKADSAERANRNQLRQIFTNDLCARRRFLSNAKVEVGPEPRERPRASFLTRGNKRVRQ